MKLFETMRLDNGKIPRLQYHMTRVQQSCERLGYSFSKEVWMQRVNEGISHHPNGIYRLKIEIDKSGQIDHMIKPLPAKTLFTAKFKQAQSNCNDQYVINKTSQRQHLAHNHETDLVLLYDETGKILEFDIGNVMIEEAGVCYTPSYDHDFLLGCMRQSLLDQSKLVIKDYTKSELIDKIQKQQIRIYLLNSLREVADVSIYL
ncbi:aminotransferase class IV [Staphylococcus borealis]|uniref:aminotransferase class IV n=1 Tax=Staphylococcus borealis TaxID=2742203 RepID=UPI002A8136D7|nr:aminotransferase class IV [Staphylococcus borealis]MDY4022630.1 aminotransferase class IV [Staphylococcus borealis]